MFLLILSSACQLTPESSGTLSGQVLLGGELAEARVGVWALDGATGQPTTRHPLDIATTDDRGRFQLAIGTASGTLMVVAFGGILQESWSDQAIPLDPDVEHLRSVQLDFRMGEQRSNILVTPFTSLAARLAARRLERGLEPSYTQAAATAHGLLARHLSIENLSAPERLGSPAGTEPGGATESGGAAPMNGHAPGHMPGPGLGLGQGDGSVLGSKPGPGEGSGQSQGQRSTRAIRSVLFDDHTRHHLAVLGLSWLAQRMAAESVGDPAAPGAPGVPGAIDPLLVNSLFITRMLEEDLGDPSGLLDGIGPRGPLVLGSCTAAANDWPPGCESGTGRCRTVCQLDADTLRIDLVAGLVFGFLRFQPGDTSLGLGHIGQIGDWLSTLQANDDVELFGQPPWTDSLDPHPPSVALHRTVVLDERGDRILFDEQARPVTHVATGPAIELGDVAGCPDVYKYAYRTRNDDPGHNPIALELSVTDEGVGIAPGTIGYRVRVPGSATWTHEITRSSAVTAAGSTITITPLGIAPLGEPASSGDGSPDGSEDGSPDGSGDGSPDGFGDEPGDGPGDDAGYALGYRVRVVLLGPVVPELETPHEGLFEVELFAEDWLGNPVESNHANRACFHYRPLAAPLRVHEPRVAVGPESFRETVGLDRVDADGNPLPSNLAPLLNADPTDDLPGLGIMSIDIDNGNDAAVLVAFEYSQPLVARYTKWWIETNAFLEAVDILDEDCFATPPTCPMQFYPEDSTYHDAHAGDIAQLIQGVRVFEVVDSEGSELVEIGPCAECVVDEFRLSGRLPSSDGPRRFRVMLVTRHIPELAPHAPDDTSQGEVEWQDALIHPVFHPTFIAGHLLRVHALCLVPAAPQCEQLEFYQRYRALGSASVQATHIYLSGRTRPHPAVTSRSYTPLRELELPQFLWHGIDPDLPPHEPDLL